MKKIVKNKTPPMEQDGGNVIKTKEEGAEIDGKRKFRGQTRRTEGGGNVTRAALSIIGIWIGLPMTGSLLDGGQTWAGIIAGLASLILIAGGVMTEDGDADA